MRPASVWGESAYGDIPLGIECALPALPAPTARRSPRVLRLLILALVGIALWQFGQAGYIHAKAWLSQTLIARAWERTRASGLNARPWPWADTWPVARLAVPRLHLRRYVLAGADGRTIAFGPGHVHGTASPGEGGNSVIGGHRDTHFAFLADLKIGDEIVVETAAGVVRRYRVSSTHVTHKNDLSALTATASPRLTLVTCYPFDAIRAGGPLRYLVVAEGTVSRHVDS